MYYRIRKETLNTFFGSVGKLNDECVVDIDEDGISTLVMDKGGVALIYCHVGPVGYDLVEEMDDERKVPEGKYGIAISEFMTALNTLGADIELTFTPDCLTLKSDHDGFNVRTLDIRTIKTPSQMPTKGAEVKVSLPGKEFYNAIKASSTIASMTHIEVDPGISTVKFRSRCESRGDSMNYSKDLPDLQIEGEHSTAMYSNLFIKEVSKYFSSLEEIIMYIGTDKPLKIEAMWPDMDLSMVYFLAPRLEHD